jgi:multiple sugar transport system substrate-binding protein
MLSFSLFAGSQAESTGSEVSDEPVTILINTSPWLPGFEEVVKEYEQTTGRDIELNVNPFNALLPKSRNAVQADESEFDIINMNEQWFLEFYANEWVTPITDIDPDFTLDPNIISYDNAAYWDPDNKVASEDGIIYGLPVNGNIQLFFYRKDIYEQLNLTPPKTWDEVRANSEVIDRNTDMFAYGWRTTPPEWETNAVFEGFGGGYVKYNEASSQWEVLIGSSQSIEALELQLDLTKKYGPANYQDIGQAQLLALMQSGRLAQGIVVGAAAPNLDDPEQSNVVGMMGAVPVPGLTADSRATMTGIWTMGIPHNLPAERKEAALHFLNYLLEKETEILYAQKGAIPVREDVYQELSTDPEKGWWMKAFADSTPFIKGQLRIPESAQINEVIKRQLGYAIVGSQSPTEAMTTAANEIFDIMESAGYNVTIVK